MAEHLVGIMYHAAEPYASWQRGLIEDYESSTGLYIEANSAEEAIAWGVEVGKALLRYADPNTSVDWSELYKCWLVESPTTSEWTHCLSQFQHVRVGEMPDLARITS